MALYHEQTRDASTQQFAPSTVFHGDRVTVTTHSGDVFTGEVWYMGRALRFTTLRDLLLGMLNGATLRGAFTIAGVAVVEGPAIRRIQKVATDG